MDAKCIRYADPKEWGDEGTDQVPKYILWQCHHFLTLMDFDRWHVAALVGGQELRCFEIERDKELSEMIIDADRKFWEEHVLAQVPPEIDGSDDAKTYLEQKYATHKESLLDATDEQAKMIIDLANAKKELQAWEIEAKRLENLIRAAIADNTGIVSEHGTITWKSQKGRTTFDSKRLAEDNKELYEKYLKTGEPTRVFRAKWKTE